MTDEGTPASAVDFKQADERWCSDYQARLGAEGARQGHDLPAERIGAVVFPLLDISFLGHAGQQTVGGAFG